MKHAGCEFGDIERLTRTGDVEGALHHLLRAGVYLSVDEFKGRIPAQRGSLRINVTPELLRSPRAAFHLPASSSGSRSAGTPVLIDMRFVRVCAANCMVSLDAWGGRGWVKADWETPGAGARFRLTKFGMFGDSAAAWFTQVDPNDPALPSLFRWNTRLLRWSSMMAGRPVPAPVFSPLSHPEPVVRWLHSVLKGGRTPVIFTFPGSAVRACLFAAAQGIDISGARFLIAGEPVTQARIDTIQSAGCVPMPRYGSMECGAIGYGCPDAEHPDDVHLLKHMHGLISAGDCAASMGVVPDALYITALHRHSPFLFLNVSMGDQAQFRERWCGCHWQRLGLTTHLHSIRSYEKLTGGGVTFHGTEVIRILEHLLPAEFGGSPTDYQLVEEEHASGDPVLTLRVHPAIGEVDEAKLAQTFLDRLSDGSAPAVSMARMWRDSGMLRIVRQPPAMSRGGKILHLHVNRPN
jgi:hypothetical protein